MTYAETLARLFALQRFGVRPGLGPIEAALARLGHPERDFAAIHIAGSNGKGSTAAICAAILEADGWRVGVYTSPHLARFTERIRIGGAEIGEDDVGALADEVLAAGPELTFFEIVTAMAFLAFARARVELAVIEVGLGGRLDATSALANVCVSVITGIALEHTEILGDTLGAIAREKAGILRAGVPAVAAAGSDEARDAIAAEATRVGAPLAWSGEAFDATLQGGLLRFRDGERVRQLPAPALAGSHQVRNAGLALAALARLPATLRPRDSALAAGLSAVRWPGRLERLADDLVIDGAHNPDGAAALAAALPALAAGRAVTLVLGVVAEKDTLGIVTPLLPLVTRIVATTVPSARALPAALLASRIAPLVGERRLDVVDDPRQALAAARDGGLVIVAGSLFLVGWVRAHLLGERTDPLSAQDPAPVRRAT